MAPRRKLLAAARGVRLAQLQEVSCPSCGHAYKTDLTLLDSSSEIRAVFTCWSCGHRWGVRRPARCKSKEAQ